MNQRKIGALLSYLSMGVGFIIQIAYTPVMLRLLGKNEYGLYTLVFSVVSYLGLLSFGFSGAYMRFYSRYKVKGDSEGIARLNGLFISVFTIFAFLALLFGGIMVGYSDAILGNKFSFEELATAKILMGVLIVNISLTFPATIFNAYIIAHEKFVFQKLLQILKLVCSPLIALPILLMGYGSVGMVSVTTSISILVIVLNMIFCFKKLNMKIVFSGFDFGLLREIALFSFFMFLNMIIDQVNWNIGKFFLGRFQGARAVADFGLAAQLNMYFISVSTVISTMFIPMINDLVTKGKMQEVDSIFTRIGRLQFIMLSLLATGLIFLGKPFIVMWAGEEYVKAHTILLLLILPVIIPLCQNLGIEIQKAMNKHRFRSLIYFVMAIINIIISIPLIKNYGGIGAGMATAISILVANGMIMNIYYHYAMKMNMIAFWCSILRFIPALIIPCMVGISSMIYIDLYKPFNFIATGLIYTASFGLSFWFFGLNKYEKCLILNPVKKVYKKFIV